MKKVKKNKGSVLIITIIVASVLLSIGMAFSAVIEKEIQRQIYSERSQIALNITNTALECVLYNDFRRLIFTPILTSRLDTKETFFDCGYFVQVREKGNWGTQYSPKLINTKNEITGVGYYEFSVIEAEADKKDLSGIFKCAEVKVIKRCPNPIEGNQICPATLETVLEVRGYDRCKEKNQNERDLVRLFRIYY